MLSAGPTVLVIVAKFPNRIQPWLLNTLEIIAEYGGSHWVVSGAEGDHPHSPKVDTLGLPPRILTLPLSDVSSARRALLGALTPWDRVGRLSRRGLSRLLWSGRLFRGTIKDVANRVIMSPTYSLPNIDVIHSHSMRLAYHYLEVAEALGVPQVHTFHGLLPAGVPELPSERRQQVFDRVSVFLTNTEFAKRQLESSGCPRDKIRVLPQGTVLTEFPYAPHAHDPEEPLRLLAVGRLHPDKGHRYAIEAVRMLRERGVPVQYRIAGVGPNRAELETLSRDLDVEENVTFLGGVFDEELLAEYHESDIVVLSSVANEDGSWQETQGVVLQEAQACGTLVVATSTGGIPECLDDGVSAFLVPDRDAASLADKLEWIAERRGSWTEWQRLGRAWVEERFDIRVVGQSLTDLYSELCTHR